jgi:F-type H+-transporting ATPase subunit g
MRPTTLQATRAIFRRFASTSSSSPSSVTQNPQVKNAVEGATKAYEQAMSGAKRVAGPLGDRAGAMLGGALTGLSLPARTSNTQNYTFFSNTGYRDPLMYNFKVFTSLCRQVYIAERLAPPTNLSAWTTAYAKIWSRATSAAWYKTIAQNGEWAKVGIYVSLVEMTIKSS